MNIKEVKIDSLHLPNYCNRAHPPEQIDRFISEIKKHNQYQPIVVSEDEILCGVLIWTALKELGKETCFVNDLGKLEEEKKKEIRYLDNQIFDIEDWDENAIKKFFMRLNTSELDKFGFSEKEIDRIMNEENEIKTSPAKIQFKEIWECDNCGWKGTVG